MSYLRKLVVFIPTTDPLMPTKIVPSCYHMFYSLFFDAPARSKGIILYKESVSSSCSQMGLIHSAHGLTLADRRCILFTVHIAFLVPSPGYEPSCEMQ